MSKERRTVSVDKEIDDYLGSEGVNASELVNRLVRNHLSSGGDKRSMLELRSEQLRSDIDELEGRLETKEKELEKVERQLQSYQEESEGVITDFVENHAEVPLEPDNPAVKTKAEKAEMPVETFIQEVERRRSDSREDTPR